MRIIAGKYRRTPLKTLEGTEITRPTRDMVKEALFSTIMITSKTVFLDLFAGSGAIGLEALSRGAEEVIFNDGNKEAVRIINENLKKVKEERTVYNLDYQACLRKLEGKHFDYIYADPPYAFKDYGRIFELVKEYELLNDKGSIILEVIREHENLDDYGDYELYKEKRYGINKLLYYKEKKK